MANADFSQEIAYWDKELSLGGDYPDAIRKRSTPERMVEEFPAYLSGYFEELKAHAGASRKPRVLDVGSGPLSMLAHGFHSGLFDLTCVDPLADRYLKLLSQHGLTPNSPLVEGFGEDLVKLFPEGTFDMAWMHNALDHSQSPAEVVKGMAHSVRDGGYVVIQGWAREGTAEGWNGLHQHDLYLEPNGRLMCQSRGKAAVCISDDLPLETVETFDQPEKPRGWMRVIYRLRR
jgi:SAM-dependent methyltransferase